MSQGPSVSWSVSRSLRATDQKASESGSTAAESGSWVTGIAYQVLLLYPHIEVNSVLSNPYPGRTESLLAAPQTNRDISGGRRGPGPRGGPGAAKTPGHPGAPA